MYLAAIKKTSLKSYHFFSTLLAGAIIFTLCSCSGAGTVKPQEIAKLDKDFAEISLSQIPAIKIPTTRLKVQYKPELILAKVIDKRSNSAVIRHANREVQARGDVTLGVYYALLKAFRMRGFSITQNAPITLNTSISRWQSSVEENMLSAEAIVIAELFADDEKLYTAVFEGFHSQTSKRILDSEVQEVLTKAMSNALSELISNPQLMDFITSY